MANNTGVNTIMYRSETNQKSPIINLYVVISTYSLLMGFMVGFIHSGRSYDRIRMGLYAVLILFTVLTVCFMIKQISDLTKTGPVPASEICRLIIFSGFAVRLLYIIFSTIYMRQNDVLTLEESGHLGYISYVYIFLKPPTPGAGWEFTQPPLWYYLCAVWLRIGIRLTHDFDLLLESLQVLSLIFSVGIMIVCDRIALELRLSYRARITACIFGAFYPYMIFMSGAINNDCLATFLGMLTILYAIKWLTSLKYNHLFLTGLFFGLSLFAKFSSIVLGPALAAVFIFTFFKKQKSVKALLEYISFALISGIIGLTWPIYSRIAYGIPFGYINSASERHAGDHAVWELLFSFKNQLNHYYLNVVEGDIDYDFNIFSTIIKSGTYGVDNFMSDNPLLRITGIILLWINIILALYLVIISVLRIVKSRESMELKMFILLTIWVSILLLYGRAIYSAYTCNMELRFMLPAFLMMTLSVGIPIENDLKEESLKANTKGSFNLLSAYTPVVIVMSVLSTCMWLIVLTIRDYETIRMIIG